LLVLEVLGLHHPLLDQPLHTAVVAVAQRTQAAAQQPTAARAGAVREVLAAAQLAVVAVLTAATAQQIPAAGAAGAGIPRVAHQALVVAAL
jgi:hypothetical protein